MKAFAGSAFLGSFFGSPVICLSALDCGAEAGFCENVTEFENNEPESREFEFSVREKREVEKQIEMSIREIMRRLDTRIIVL